MRCYMHYLSVKEAAENWGMSSRRVQILCNENRIEGAQKVGSVWTIPEISSKPEDARIKINKQHKRVNESSNIDIERVWAMPNSNTFDIKSIKILINKYIEKVQNDFGKENIVSVDPFANKNKIANITNDLDPQYKTTCNMDALDFLKIIEYNYYNNNKIGILLFQTRR